MFSAADHEFMAQALRLAERGLCSTTPNPRVGCVLVRDAAIVGEGWHERAGGPHAEVHALQAAGAAAAGATAYVTLEPCSHHGRTPPCCEALLAAGVQRVVAAMPDPNPLVAGQGLAWLRDAGLAVESGLLAAEARELNIGFVSRMERGRPWVRLKAAASLDGRTALHNGHSQWITGEAARADGHVWRSRACAILTGIGTVRDDDPQMTVRMADTTWQPLRVLVDSRLEVDLQARLLRGGALVASAHPNPDKEAELRDRGCEVLHLPDAAGKVDLLALIAHLAERGINEVHVEAGARLNGSLIRAGCVDELLVYLAPSLLGDAAGMLEGLVLDALDDRVRLKFHAADRVGDDLRILARLSPR